MSFLIRLLEFIFPPRCVFCGSLMESGSALHICGLCYEKIPFTGENLIRLERGGEDSGCDGAICVCRYSGMVKDSLIRFKFYSRPGYYRAYAKLLSSRIMKVTGNRRFDMIISVPLHKHKEYTRGYNQAYLISKALSREINLPECSYLLERSRFTDAQSLLDKERRRENVKNAFRVTNNASTKGKSVLLIDDILTTGCTINECSRTLKEAGAKSVTAAVVATGKKL